MPVNATRHGGTTMLFEMEEFASFAKGIQRYIRRSLDVGLGRRDAIARWARSDDEAKRIREQQAIYAGLDGIRARLAGGVKAQAIGPLLAALVPLTVFDLGEGRLPGFSAYRFLYERLIGARARPWLPTAFCAAASLPDIHPGQRCKFLESVATAAVCNRWSTREPGFLPEWIEKVDATIAA
jgi:hypothetical protein